MGKYSASIYITIMFSLYIASIDSKHTNYRYLQSKRYSRAVTGKRVNINFSGKRHLKYNGPSNAIGQQAYFETNYQHLNTSKQNNNAVESSSGNKTADDGFTKHANKEVLPNNPPELNQGFAASSLEELNLLHKREPKYLVGKTYNLENRILGAAPKTDLEKSFTPHKFNEIVNKARIDELTKESLKVNFNPVNFNILDIMASQEETGKPPIELVNSVEEIIKPSGSNETVIKPIINGTAINASWNKPVINASIEEQVTLIGLNETITEPGIVKNASNEELAKPIGLNETVTEPGIVKNASNEELAKPIDLNETVTEPGKVMNASNGELAKPIGFNETVTEPGKVKNASNEELAKPIGLNETVTEPGKVKNASNEELAKRIGLNETVTEPGKVMNASNEELVKPIGLNETVIESGKVMNASTEELAKPIGLNETVTEPGKVINASNEELAKPIGLNETVTEPGIGLNASNEKLVKPPGLNKTLFQPKLQLIVIKASLNKPFINTSKEELVEPLGLIGTVIKPILEGIVANVSSNKPVNSSNEQLDQSSGLNKTVEPKLDEPVINSSKEELVDPLGLIGTVIKAILEGIAANASSNKPVNSSNEQLDQSSGLNKTVEPKLDEPVINTSKEELVDPLGLIGTVIKAILEGIAANSSSNKPINSSNEHLDQSPGLNKTVEPRLDEPVINDFLKIMVKSNNSNEPVKSSSSNELVNQTRSDERVIEFILNTPILKAILKVPVKMPSLNENIKPRLLEPVLDAGFEELLRPLSVYEPVINPALEEPFSIFEPVLYPSVEELENRPGMSKPLMKSIWEEIIAMLGPDLIDATMDG